MGKAKKKYSENYALKRRETKKQSMRKAREKLKLDPVKHEEAKIKDRERKKAQRKSIKEMSDREQRKTRKMWKKCSKTYRDKLKKDNELLVNLEANTPPGSPDIPNNGNDVSGRPSTSRLSSGKKIRRKNRQKLLKKIEDLELTNNKLKKRVDKYRQRFYREKKSPGKKDTPRKTVKKLLKGLTCPESVKKKLVFSEVMKLQVKQNFGQIKDRSSRKSLAQLISGKVVKKYKCVKQVISLTSQRALKSVSNTAGKKSLLKFIKQRTDVILFLENDEHSKQCAGKRETITRKKVKKQKRLLNDSLINLHEKFIKSYPEYTEMSYSKFCSLKPFWILKPNCSNRDTCLCKLHTNFHFLVNKLNNIGIIKEKTTDEVLKSLTCDGKMEEKCLERQCKKCKDSDIALNEEFDGTDSVTFFQWVDKKYEIKLKGEMKMCKKTVKEEIVSTKGELIISFKCLLMKFVRHVCNLKHQYAAIRKIKEDLSENEMLLHMDFSENYNCKYSSEIQSVHFGGSRKQVTLHTSILYHKVEGTLKINSFCTFSNNTSHNNEAICNHLKPVFTEIKRLVPNIHTIHFVSDGPSSQYRNRKMFILATKYLSPWLNVKNMHWHYLESGHGKGAADGVGGVLKRTADDIVARGTDLPDIDALASQLKISCPGVKIIVIPDDDFIELIVEEVPQFKGIMKCHEIYWSAENMNTIHVRRLTCTDGCKGVCSHYEIGQMLIGKPEATSSKKQETTHRKKPIYSAIYSDDSDPDDPKEILNVKINDFVVVKVFGRKNTVNHYAGCVTKCFNEGGYQIRFMRRCSDTKNKFLFSPEPEASVNKDEIVAILKQPNLVNSRGQYVFDVLPQQFKLLG